MVNVSYLYCEKSYAFSQQAGVEPMTFRTSVGCSTTELQETRGSLGHTTRFELTTLINRDGKS